ncbi:MAG: glycosyltransferase [Actinobacteria bacterium]|nr:glycosyltransferase [Actinomycetota bacterium]
MSLAVIIPARDEEALIARCLTSVLEAARHVLVHVDIQVVADGCLDSTVPIARTFPGVRILELESSNVGAARAAGAEAVLARGAHWLANTDADSVVPPNWLAHQVALEREGWDAVVGTVRPDFAELDAGQRAAWLATHRVGEPNGHVHGANLGLRASVYRAVGGYLALPEHEDADLVARLDGYRVIATDEAEVVTSARRFGRTPGGYARFLREELFSHQSSTRVP